MKEKEAREIVSKPLTDPLNIPLLHEAEGYLEAIEKVKGLEKALQLMDCTCDEEESAGSCNEKVAEEALAKWEKEK